MVMAEDVVIVGGARTPFCEWQGGKRGDGQPGGLLKDVSALKLGEIAIKGALEHQLKMSTMSLWDMHYKPATKPSSVHATPDLEQVFHKKFQC